MKGEGNPYPSRRRGDLIACGGVGVWYEGPKPKRNFFEPE